MVYGARSLVNSVPIVSWLNCCVAEQPQKARKLDPSMIGLPSNFQHVGHIGSTDHSVIARPSNNNNMSDSEFTIIQGQMRSKGGYMVRNVPLHSHLRLIDLPPKTAEVR